MVGARRGADGERDSGQVGPHFSDIRSNLPKVRAHVGNVGLELPAQVADVGLELPAQIADVGPDSRPELRDVALEFGPKLTKCRP